MPSERKSGASTPLATIEEGIVGQAHRLPDFGIRQPERLPYNRDMGHPPRIPVWLQWDQGVIYFVTFCVANRAKVLANEQTFRAFKSAVSRLRGWSVLAALLMPDHVHLLAAPTEDREAKLGNLVGALKRWTREELDAPWLWQPGSFDRLLRRDESAHEKWLYIEQNPVRAGLVIHAEDWPYRIGFDE